MDRHPASIIVGRPLALDIFNVLLDAGTVFESADLLTQLVQAETATNRLAALLWPGEDGR